MPKKPPPAAVTPAPPTKGRVGKPIADGPLKPLAEKMGGMGAIAKAMNVHFRTASKWNMGDSTPEGPARMLLAMLAAQHGMKPPFPVDS